MNEVAVGNSSLADQGGPSRNELEGRVQADFEPRQEGAAMRMTTQTADRTELDTTLRSFAATRFAEALREKIVGQGAMLDIDIQTPDWPGQMETILGELKQLRESNAFLEKRQTEIEAELSLAARVQQSLAPRSLVWNDVSVETYYNPAHTIGGDFGIVFPHNDEVLTILMCDVSGHGIGSALMANRIYSETLHHLEREATPCDLLRHLHDFAHVRLATDGFYFTMAVIRFSMRGRRATFVAGGHPPAIYVSNGGMMRLLESQNGILGCLSEITTPPSTQEIEFAPGDRLVLYTDGLVEVFNSRHDMLGVDGLQELVRQSATRPFPEMKQIILDGSTAWSHGPLSDDVSLVVVEVR